MNLNILTKDIFDEGCLNQKNNYGLRTSPRGS